MNVQAYGQFGTDITRLRKLRSSGMNSLELVQSCVQNSKKRTDYIRLVVIFPFSTLSSRIAL